MQFTITDHQIRVIRHALDQASETTGNTILLLDLADAADVLDLVEGTVPPELVGIVNLSIAAGGID
jgi:hypothetical protein